jgi:hypothetical protein
MVYENGHFAALRVHSLFLHQPPPTASCLGPLLPTTKLINWGTMVPLFRVFDGQLRVFWYHLVPSWNILSTMLFDGSMMEHVVPLVP